MATRQSGGPARPAAHRASQCMRAGSSFDLRPAIVQASQAHRIARPTLQPPHLRIPPPRAHPPAARAPPLCRVIAAGGFTPSRAVSGYDWALASAGAPGAPTRRGKCRTGQPLTGRGEGLWVLTRSAVDPVGAQAGIDAAAAMGFDTQTLKPVDQRSCGGAPSSAATAAAPEAVSGRATHGAASADAAVPGAAIAGSGPAIAGSGAAAAAPGLKLEAGRGLFRVTRHGAVPAGVNSNPAAAAAAASDGAAGWSHKAGRSGAAAVATASPAAGPPAEEFLEEEGEGALAGVPPLGSPLAVTRQVYFDLEQGGKDLGRVVVGL
jgi:hypothetical protein